MGVFWQAPDELPFWIQLFLLAFILIGLIPFFEKFNSKIQDFFRAMGGLGEPDKGESTTRPEIAAAEPSASTQLSEYEYIVFSRLAQSGGKGFPPKTIAESLHLDRSRVGKVMQSLGNKGLVRIGRGYLFGRRFYLTPKGRDYAVEQGFIVKVRERGKR